MKNSLNTAFAKICKVLTLSLATLLSEITWAESYKQDFESHDFPIVVSFSYENNSISTRFNGGSVIDASELESNNSGSKHWVLESFGTNERGVHSGLGHMIFNQDIKNATFRYKSTDSDLTATVQLLDGNNNVIEGARSFSQPISCCYSSYTFRMTEGSSALRQIIIEVKGSGFLLIDNVNLENTGTGAIDDIDKVNQLAGSVFWLLLIIASLGLKRIRTHH